jgi:sugar phosphate isomerase/epimerase
VTIALLTDALEHRTLDDASWPVFAGGAWLGDMEDLWEHQWSVISAHWSELASWAAETAPDVAICRVLHPGTSIDNAESFLRLAAVTGPDVRVQLDPSHFWWQGIDPLATIEAVGEHIGFVHGKDPNLSPEDGVVASLHGLRAAQRLAGARTAGDTVA